MLTALRHAVLFAICLAFSTDAFAQEPIRIDRPQEGSTVELEIEVAGVATPGATVEVWVDRVFIVDTIAEPDGWYVARLQRPPNATENSRIFVHELNAAGERTSSAVVRVKWSEQPVPEKPVVPPPDVAVAPVEGGESEPPMPDTVEGSTATATEGDAVVAGEPAPASASGPSRTGRIAVESLVSVVGGITGAVVGLLIASPLGAPDSTSRFAASVLLGSVGGAMGAGGAVYGVGRAMHGSGSFMWSAAGGLIGALLVVTVGVATDNSAGGLWVPVGIVAFGLPVLAFELSSDAAPQTAPAPATAAPTFSIDRDGKPSVGVRFAW